MQLAKCCKDPSQPESYRQWRVAVDDPAAIHIEDLILVQLRQVSVGSWVPEIDVIRSVDSSVPTVEEAVGHPTTSLSHEFSPTYIPQGSRERVPVPLRPWEPSQKSWSFEEELLTIDFSTEDTATGGITPGTYLADHWDNNPDRSLIDSETFPLEGKLKKYFILNLHVGSALLLPHVTVLTLGIG